MTDLDHCQPSTTPCWLHYGPHELTQPPVRWVIELASAVLKLRVRSLELFPSLDASIVATESALRLQSLLQRQWTEMVREPYPFHPGEDSIEMAYEETPETKTKALDLLMKLGLKKLEAPLRRRRLT